MVAALLVIVVVARVGMLQTVDKADYASYGERQRVRSVVIPAERGAIFDRDGQVLAMSVPVMTIWADPRADRGPGQTTAALAAALNLSPAETAQLQQRLAQPGAKTNADKSEFEYVQRQVDQARSPTRSRRST